MKNNKTPLYIVGGLLIGLLLCSGVAAAGYIAYNTFANPALQEFVDEAPVDLPELSDNPTPIPTQPSTSLDAQIEFGDLFQPLWETYTLLADNYVVLPLDNDALADGAVEGLNFALEQYDINLAGLDSSADAPSIETLAERANTPDDLNDAFSVYWEAWQKIETSELPDEISYEFLMQESIRGMVDALGDPHTTFFDPDQLRQVNIDLEGSYEGIGAWVDPTADYLTIVAPIPGSPAEAAGLQPGDRIIAVDGDDMTGIDGDLVIKRVLGPAGTPVLLTIERDGEEDTFDVEIIRATIVIPTTETKMLEGNIAYLHLFNFGADSAEVFHNDLESLLGNDPAGLIIDLRNNGGGYLYAVVNIASEFVSDGVIVYEEYGDGTRDVLEAVSGGLATDDLPIVVLVNEGTASASEILSGVMQDYDRGVLVGNTTFGKGSVQLQLNIPGYNGAIRVTIARWLTPNERHIHGIGLDPDFEVDLTEADVENGDDPQLDFAIQYLIDLQ